MATFKARFRETNSGFTATFGEVIPVDPHPYPDAYEGPYEVTPSFSDQVLCTAKKQMSDDVTVEKIPMAEVSNTAGGLTLIIGG